MQIIGQKKFATIALILDKKVFIMYMTCLKAKMSIYLDWKAQIILLLAKNVSIPKEYANFLNVFLKKSAVVLFDCLNINKYIINLEPSKQLLYRLIYSLNLVELKTFKIYIKTNLANGFI